MKKRIEEDDVIYTIDKNSGDCIDIDVKPGVEEVSFNASFGREYLLGDCKKVFPDVRKIVIDYSVSLHAKNCPRQYLYQASFFSSFSCLMQCFTPALYIRSVILIILFSLSYLRLSVIIRLVTTKDGVVFFAI